MNSESCLRVNPIAAKVLDQSNKIKIKRQANNTMADVGAFFRKKCGAPAPAWRSGDSIEFIFISRFDRLVFAENKIAEKKRTRQIQ
ncbi:MAG: hypothetical protein A2283_05820 [Lentisphaerae bacterium RIFOXYA12_FULL_48_11]|nr:MAG: hypothetical protein A2283_05820 [Lentisphaerae bacterium RIFOXYA12_FULL_48_11]